MAVTYVIYKLQMKIWCILDLYKNNNTEVNRLSKQQLRVKESAASITSYKGNGNFIAVVDLSERFFRANVNSVKNVHL